MLPKDAVVIEETLSSAPGARSLINSNDEQSFFALRGGGIGWGLPAAIGAKLALPDRPVVALVGDGSAMYTVQALWTAAHYKLPIVWVIFNNTSYRILKQRLVAMRGLAEQADTFVGMELTDPAIDFVGLARSLGIEAAARQDRSRGHRSGGAGTEKRQRALDRRRHGAELQADVAAGPMPRIAVFTKNRTNPAYEAARLGADRVAARFGATTAHYVPDEPDSVPEQIALIARAIAARPDAAVFVPVHETACNDAILGFDAAGIPLFNIITRTTAGRRVSFVGSDDRALAQNIARYLFARLSGRGTIIIVEGTPASATSHARLKGFKDALAEHTGIAVRASLSGEYQRDAAREEFLGAREHWPGLDAVLCANDAMALGVLDALDAQAGSEPRPLVAGVNAIPEAVAAIAAGRMLATANFDAMAMSEIATEAAVRHLRGEAVPAEIMLPVEVIDAENCAAWNRPFASRPSPDWDAVVAAQAAAG